MGIVVLDKQKHAKLKVIPNPSCAHMRNHQLTLITLKEFSRAANNFPIVLVKDDKNGEFGTVVLFGLQAGENVIYGEDQWRCSYAPMSVLRHPFILAHDENDPEPNRLSLSFEDDKEFVNEKGKEGQLLYTENGDETEVLVHYRRLIAELFENEKSTYEFLQVLSDLDLIVPFSLVIATESGQKKQLQGLYTINAERLAGLDDEQVLKLHKLHYLGPIYSMMDSLGQFNLLIKYKNEKEEDPILQFDIAPQ